MICGLCLKRSDQISVTSYGLICPGCLPGLEGREQALYDELLREDSVSMPPILDVEAFERVILKFSLHWLMGLRPDQVNQLSRERPILLRPRMKALWMKERVIGKIPLMYVSSMDTEGQDAFFHGGIYQFKKGVPDVVVLEALRRCGYVKLEEEGL